MSSRHGPGSTFLPASLLERGSRISGRRSGSLEDSRMALLRSVATVGSYTLISRVLGFVRDILTAAILGAGPVADAFFVAQRLPNLFRGLFAERSEERRVGKER